MRRCPQPGPPRATASDSAPCAAVPVEVPLQAGVTLLDAAGAWMLSQGCDGALLTLADVPVTGLRYVLPDASTDPAFAAYYSPDHFLHGPGLIRSGQMILGWRDGAPFAHCHGLFQDAAGHLACGHLRVESCMLGAGVVLTGHAWRGAAFVAQPCRETNFVLLTPVSLYTVTANAAIVKLSPNQDIGAALTDAAAARGLGDATVLGLGSLVGAVFDDAQRLERIETEFFFDQARLQAGAADLNVTVVEAGGRRLSGRLAHGENAVLMTVEALLISSPDASSEPCRR
ncbi:MAG: hypothetical protein O9289_20210 [Rhodobacteraceae bacterium]|nr:hypothetical protein [Paracoccaceae bacterium]MCZ8085520.1 hypothetical protein [Paracoccaceae bacterium]